MGQGFGVSLFFVYGLEAFLFGLFDSYVRTKNALVIIGFTDTLYIPAHSLCVSFQLGGFEREKGWS